MDLFHNQFMNSSSESDFLESANNSFSQIQNDSYETNRLSYGSRASTDVVMPNIFVTIPINSNSNRQTSNQSHQSTNGEIKSEPIKLEFSDNNNPSNSSQTKETSRPESNKYKYNKSNVEPKKSFNLPSSLVTARPKSTIKCYKCELCPYISISQNALSKHKNISHKQLTDKNFNRKFSCPGCDNVFYTRNSLEFHLLNDHQMDDSEIEPLVSSLCEDIGHTDEPLNTIMSKKKTTTTTAKSKSGIYIKNVKILQKPNLINRDKTTPPTLNTNNINSNIPNNNNNDTNNTQILDAMSVLMNDTTTQHQIQQLEQQQQRNKNKSKIFIKNDNILKEPNLIERNNNNNNNIDENIYRRDQDFFRDNFLQLSNTFDNNSDIFLNDTYTSSSATTTTHQTNTSIINKHEIISRPKSKIYIKNVDILKNPIYLNSTSPVQSIFQQTHNVTPSSSPTLSSSSLSTPATTITPTPTVTYPNLPHFNFVQIQNNYNNNSNNNIDLTEHSENYIIDVHSNSSNSYQNSPHSNNNLDLNNIDTNINKQGNKIYIKNVNILKETKLTDEQCHEINNSGNCNGNNNGLHLRTVDELNLLNLNDVQSYMVDLNHHELNTKTKIGLNDSNNSHSNNYQCNDEVIILDEYNDLPELIISDSLQLDAATTTSTSCSNRNFHDINTNYNNYNRFQQSRILGVADLLYPPVKLNHNQLKQTCDLTTQSHATNPNTLDDYTNNNNNNNEYVIVQSTMQQTSSNGLSTLTPSPTQITIDNYTTDYNHLKQKDILLNTNHINDQQHQQDQDHQQQQMNVINTNITDVVCDVIDDDDDVGVVGDGDNVVCDEQHYYFDETTLSNELIQNCKNLTEQTHLDNTNNEQLIQQLINNNNNNHNNNSNINNFDSNCNEQQQQQQIDINQQKLQIEQQLINQIDEDLLFTAKKSEFFDLNNDEFIGAGGASGGGDGNGNDVILNNNNNDDVENVEVENNELQISENTFGSNNNTDHTVIDYKSTNNNNNNCETIITGDNVLRKNKRNVSGDCISEDGVVGGSGGNTSYRKHRGRPKGAKQSGITQMKKIFPGLTTKEIGYKCINSVCAMRFRNKTTMEYHEKCHSNNLTNPSLNDNNNNILCPECNQLNFRNWNTLHTHLWRHHEIDMELFSCKLCKFKTPILSRLNNTHIKIHSDERNYKCDQCEKAFKNTKQLKNHRRCVHRQQDVCFKKCIHCSATFSKSNTLKMHIENVHELNEQYRCIYCEKNTSTKSSLKTHMLLHFNEKRFKCDNDKCLYTTNDHNAFRRHKMKHNKTLKGNYLCPYCKYTSIQSTTFRNHILKIHADKASEIIFQCQKCTYVTINKLKFELHQLKHSFDDEKTKTNELTNINENHTEESDELHDDEDDDVDDVDDDVNMLDVLNNDTNNCNLINVEEKNVTLQQQQDHQHVDDEHHHHHQNNLTHNDLILCESSLRQPSIFVNNFSNIENFGQRSKILKLTDKIETIQQKQSEQSVIATTTNINLEQQTNFHDHQHHHQQHHDVVVDDDCVCFNIDLT